LTCEGTSYMEASRVAAAAMAAAERGGWMVANERDGYSDTYDAPVKRVDVTKDYIA